MKKIFSPGRLSLLSLGQSPLLTAVLLLLLAFTSNTGIAAPADSLRDGQHDFDFNFGNWKTHILRCEDPFATAPKWIQLNGTVSVRKVWNGRAQLEEIEADGPTGHFEGTTLFLYNPLSHQWSQNFASSSDGQISTPTIGEFKDGRGELFCQETFNGKAVLVRGVWSDILPDSHSYEEFVSADGGKSWQPVFTAKLTRDNR